MDRSSSNIRNNGGHSFRSQYDVQSRGSSLGFQQSGTYEGIQNMYGGFNNPRMHGEFRPSHPPMNVAPAAGMQPCMGSHVAGQSVQYSVASTQIPHGSSLGHPGFQPVNPVNNSSTNYVAGSISGIPQMPAAIGNHRAASLFEASPFLGNANSQTTNAMGIVPGSGVGHMAQITRSSLGALSNGNHVAAPVVGASPFLGNENSQITNAMRNVTGSGVGHNTRSSDGTLSIDNHGVAPVVGASPFLGNADSQITTAMGNVPSAGIGHMAQITRSSLRALSNGNHVAAPVAGASPFLGNENSQITNAMRNVTGSGVGHNTRSSDGTLSIDNHGAAPVVGASPFLGNADSQITNAMRNVTGAGVGHITRSSGGALSMPGFDSRPNPSTKSASGNMGLQTNSLMRGLQEEDGCNSCASNGGLVSQSHAESASNLNSMAMLNDVDSNDKLTISVDDVPSLTHQPNSARGDQGQIGSLQQGIDGTTQQNQEFIIRDEDFPALPTAKGVYSSPHQQKHQQNILSVTGGSDSSTSVNHPGQIPDSFPPSNSMHDIQLNDSPDNGLIRSTNNMTAMSLNDRPMQQNQQQIPSSSHVQHLPANDPYGLLGLRHALLRRNPDLDCDLRSLLQGLDSSEPLHEKFYPWSGKPVDVSPDSFPTCYYFSQPPPLNENVFKKLQLKTLFYSFYSMPKDEAQLYAANELYKRGWFYHKDLKKWCLKSPNTKPLAETSIYQIGSFLTFEPDIWDTKTVKNLCVTYSRIEQAPVLPCKQASNSSTTVNSQENISKLLG